MGTTKKGKEGNPRRGKMAAGADGKAQFESGASAAAPKYFDADKVCEELALWWYPERGDAFMRRGPNGQWAQWTKDAVVDAMRALPDRMIAIKARENEMLSESKQVLLHARNVRVLDAVYPSLPGYVEGLHVLDSKERVVVKHSPQLVEAKEGEWPHIRQLIEGMMDRRPEGGIDQSPYFYSWCKVAAEAIRNGSPGHWRAGHALILTGPAGCGKNRIQENIITPLLGGYGRFADPAKFLFESDEFNGDVFAAEHLMLSEIPMPSQKTVDRVALAEKIKQVVANPAQRMRLMRTEPCTVSPFWRLTISVNDDKDKLRSLPMITGDFGDKVIILHCRRVPLPLLEEDTEETWKLFRETMEAELPCFLHWLINEWQIPDALKHYPDGRSATRFGFREYHAPCIKESLYEETPQAELMRLIDMARFTSKDAWSPDVEGGEDGAQLWDLIGDREPLDSRGNRMRVWWGRAETLQMWLTNEGPYRCSVATMAKALFHKNRASVLLARLHQDEAFAEIRLSKVDADTRSWKGWRIAPPSE